MEHIKLFESFFNRKSNQDILNKYNIELGYEHDFEGGVGHAHNKYNVKQVMSIIRKYSNFLNKNFYEGDNNYVIKRQFNYMWGNDKVILINFYKIYNDFELIFTDNRENSFKRTKDFISSPNYFSYGDYTVTYLFNDLKSPIRFLNDCGINIDYEEVKLKMKTDEYNL